MAARCVEFREKSSLHIGRGLTGGYPLFLLSANLGETRKPDIRGAAFQRMELGGSSFGRGTGVEGFNALFHLGYEKLQHLGKILFTDLASKLIHTRLINHAEATTLRVVKARLSTAFTGH